MDGENGLKKRNEPNLLEFAETEIFKDVMYFDLLGLSHDIPLRRFFKNQTGQKIKCGVSLFVMFSTRERCRLYGRLE